MPFSAAMSSSSSRNHLHPNPSFSPDAHDDDTDELDFFDSNDDGGNILDAHDPLQDDHAHDHAPLSFKRKQKQSTLSGGLLSQPARLLSVFTGGASASVGARQDAAPLSSPPGGITTEHSNHFHGNNTKDGGPLDWYVEGPGRRVGYEDLTAIDWIFEYTKERQRLRVLGSSAAGLLGYVQQFLDASQVWLVLVLTGLAVGALAAGIDVATDWLGDIKYGFCSTEDGGAFYLSKTSCCIGYEEQAKCTGWNPWSAAFSIHSASGKWLIEYLVYLVLAVSSVYLWLHQRHANR